MFDEEVRRVLDCVGRGSSVRIVGSPGSGRTTVMQRIVAELERTGTEVFSLSGTWLLRDYPLFGLEALGLDLRARTMGPLGMADALAERLAREGNRVLVVDDIDLLDNESLAVVDIVQKRTQRSLVMTMADPFLSSTIPVLGLDRWPEAQIRLAPLRYDQVSQLITHTLGFPPDVDLAAHILMKSAGNPRIVVRIAQSALASKLLVLSDGEWRMAAHTLWNENLQGAVEAHLQGLNEDELKALHALSVVGTKPMEFLHSIVDPYILERLEMRGLIAVMEDANNDICVAVSPPIVVDYFRDHQVLAARRILTDRIARVAGSPWQNPLEGPQVSPPLAALLRDLLAEASTAGAAVARHFQEQLRVLEEEQFRLWESDPTAANAALFLRFYWGGQIDPLRIDQVFAETKIDHADSVDILFFTMTRALWSILSGHDVAAASAVLTELERTHPVWQAEAKAFAVFLAASFDRMPENWDGIMDGLVSQHPETGVLSVIRGILEIYRFEPQAALCAIDRAAGFELAGGIEPFVRGLALFIAGGSEEALIYALNKRSEARRVLDQFCFVACSYVAALALVQRGMVLEAEHVMSSVFSLGRPGFLVNFLQDAMLRIAGLRALAGSGANRSSLGVQARKDVAEIGPLPGTGKAVYDLVFQTYSDPRVFEEKSVGLLEQQLERGYITEAVFASLFMFSLLPGRKMLDRMARLFYEIGHTSHDQFLAVASAVVDDDFQLLGILVDRYEPDGDLLTIGRLLAGASKRKSMERDPDSALAFQRISSAFDARFPLLGPHLALFTSVDQPQSLSARETEVAVLAGNQTNIEIGERLGISTRTVENHISRALRKTGTISRKALYEFVRSSRA